MDDLERPRRQSAERDPFTDPAAHDETAAEPDAPSAMDVALMLQLAHAMQQEEEAAPSASDQAFGAASAPAADTKRKRPTSSHDGGFTGFGAEFQPYSYTDPHENHRKLDPEVRRLGAQHVRVFVPLAACTTGLLGKAGTDLLKHNIDTLTAQAAAHPDDAHVKKQLEQAQHDYAQAREFVASFEKTLALAGKHTTINLTFCGGTGHDARVDEFSQVVRYLVGQGYTNLQLTLENEPNGPDQGDGFRGRFNKGIAHHDPKASDAAAKEYVHAYQRLDEELSDANAGNVRDQVTVVGGDMVPNHRARFFETITRLGLNKFVDAYSFHLYWGANKGIGGALEDLHAMQALGKRYAKGKSLQITEFGKERFTTKEERAKDPAHKGVHAVEKGLEPAWEQGLFALSAVNDGFTGVVKWDAFYGGEHHKGDGKGDPGQFYMIDGPNHAYATDATYRLMRMFTHATEPGWRVHGTNHGVGGAEAHFKSADGKHGAVLAMKKDGGTVSTAGLPRHEKLYLTTWNANGKGGLETHVVPAGADSVHVPPAGAIAISTKAFG